MSAASASSPGAGRTSTTEIEHLSEVVTACGILAANRDQGVLLDTYLEDGIAGTFEDYASLVGWAGVERWIAGLCGCPLSVSWGGLTADPVTKTVVTLALEHGQHRADPGGLRPGRHDQLHRRPRPERGHLRPGRAVHDAGPGALPDRRLRAAGSADREAAGADLAGDRPGPGDGQAARTAGARSGEDGRTGPPSRREAAVLARPGGGIPGERQARAGAARGPTPATRSR